MHAPSAIELKTAALAPRLGLGTVQFGVPYGLTQGPRQLLGAEAREVLATAWANGVDLLDTAPAYGNSEAVIAAECPAGAGFEIVSKTLRIGSDRVTRADVARIVKRARQSALELPVAALGALLVHEATDLLVPGGEELYAALAELKSEGVARRIGVSVYHPEILRAVVDRYPIEVVQLPLNAFDQRFAAGGLITELAASRIEVHVRSVFMQGFLLGAHGTIPAALRGVASLAEKFRAAAAACDLDTAAAAMLLPLRQAGVGRILIGVDSAASLAANLASYRKTLAFAGDFDFAPYAIDDRDIVDPRRWSQWSHPQQTGS